MFTADTKLDIGAGFAATLNPHFNQTADPFKVNRHKRINRINLFISIIMQERSGIVTADAKRGLRQIIRPKGKEFGLNRQISRAD